MKALFALLLLMLLACAPAHGQVFSNLDFESASVPSNLTCCNVDWTVGAPGWTHSDGAGTEFLYYPHAHLGLAQWFVLADAMLVPGVQPLAGRYSVAFSSGRFVDFSSSPFIHAYLSQTGLIPSDARSINLLATGPLEVYAGNTPIPLVALGSGNAYAGDISAYAGKTVEIKFLNAANLPSSIGGEVVMIDNIAFSIVPSIPEPAPSLLIVVGILMVACARRYVRRKL
jgi:hypothetical protein